MDIHDHIHGYILACSGGAGGFMDKIRVLAQGSGSGGVMIMTCRGLDGESMDNHDMHELYGYACNEGIHVNSFMF